MKKLLIILTSLMLSFHVLSLDLISNKPYIIKSKKIFHIPQVIHFFSFFCPYCYKLETQMHLSTIVKNNFKKDFNVNMYHVNFLGGKISYALTKAWIIAEKLGIEDKILLPIFEGIQTTHTIKNSKNIKTLFLKQTHISSKKYDQFWNSFSLQLLINKQTQDVKKSNLHYIPALLINGKYIIDYSKLEYFSQDHFSEKYIKLIQFLINKK